MLSVTGLTVSFHLAVNQALRRCMSLFPNGSCSKERLDLGLPREATVSTSVKCSHVKACEDHVWKQTQHNVEADKWCRETVAYKSATAPELCQTRCRIVQIRGEILNAWFCCDHKCYGRWNKSLPPLGSVFLFFIGGGGGGGGGAHCITVKKTRERLAKGDGGGVIYLSLTLSPPEWLLH